MPIFLDLEFDILHNQRLANKYKWILCEDKIITAKKFEKTHNIFRVNECKYIFPEKSEECFNLKPYKNAKRSIYKYVHQKSFKTPDKYLIEEPFFNVNKCKLLNHKWKSLDIKTEKISLNYPYTNFIYKPELKNSDLNTSPSKKRKTVKNIEEPVIFLNHKYDYRFHPLNKKLFFTFKCHKEFKPKQIDVHSKIYNFKNKHEDLRDIYSISEPFVVLSTKKCQKKLSKIDLTQTENLPNVISTLFHHYNYTKNLSVAQIMEQDLHYHHHSIFKRYKKIHDLKKPKMDRKSYNIPLNILSMWAPSNIKKLVKFTITFSAIEITKRHADFCEIFLFAKSYAENLLCRPKNLIILTAPQSMGLFYTKLLLADELTQSQTSLNQLGFLKPIIFAKSEGNATPQDRYDIVNGISVELKYLPPLSALQLIYIHDIYDIKVTILNTLIGYYISQNNNPNENSYEYNTLCDLKQRVQNDLYGLNLQDYKYQNNNMEADETNKTMFRLIFNTYLQMFWHFDSFLQSVLFFETNSSLESHVKVLSEVISKIDKNFQHLTQEIKEDPKKEKIIKNILTHDDYTLDSSIIAINNQQNYQSIYKNLSNLIKNKITKFISLLKKCKSENSQSYQFEHSSTKNNSIKDSTTKVDINQNIPNRCFYDMVENKETNNRIRTVMTMINADTHHKLITKKKPQNNFDHSKHQEENQKIIILIYEPNNNYSTAMDLETSIIVITSLGDSLKKALSTKFGHLKIGDLTNTTDCFNNINLAGIDLYITTTQSLPKLIPFISIDVNVKHTDNKNLPVQSIKVFHFNINSSPSSFNTYQDIVLNSTTLDGLEVLMKIQHIILVPPWIKDTQKFILLPMENLTQTLNKESSNLSISQFAINIQDENINNTKNNVEQVNENNHLAIIMHATGSTEAFDETYRSYLLEVSFIIRAVSTEMPIESNMTFKPLHRNSIPSMLPTLPYLFDDADIIIDIFSAGIIFDSSSIEDMIKNIWISQSNKGNNAINFAIETVSHCMIKRLTNIAFKYQIVWLLVTDITQSNNDSNAQQCLQQIILKLNHISAYTSNECYLWVRSLEIDETFMENTINLDDFSQRCGTIFKVYYLHRASDIKRWYDYAIKFTHQWTIINNNNNINDKQGLNNHIGTNDWGKLSDETIVINNAKELMPSLMRNYPTVFNYVPDIYESFFMAYPSLNSYFIQTLLTYLKPNLLCSIDFNYVLYLLKQIFKKACSNHTVLNNKPLSSQSNGGNVNEDIIIIEEVEEDLESASFEMSESDELFLFLVTNMPKAILGMALFNTQRSKIYLMNNSLMDYTLGNQQQQLIENNINNNNNTINNDEILDDDNI